jgi:acyl-CoA synthetase (AMP-forming)/AMP-acid ligase II
VKEQVRKEQWKSYIEMFAETADKYVQRTAIVYGDRRVSYAELAGASDVIAQALLENSVKKGQIIPVILKRSPEAFAAMIGVLKAGAAGFWLSRESPMFPM